MLQLEKAAPEASRLRSEEARAVGQGQYCYKFSENTSITLDLIRAISAQLVVVGHGISFLHIALWLHEPSFPWMQNIGVLVFFLLSGLLISHSTFSKKDKPGYGFKTFFIERFSRIYTGYVPAMCLVVALDLIFINSYGKSAFPYTLDLKAFLGNLFMLEDFPLFQAQIGVTSLGSARPFWTLAVEWWLYMFFGCVVLSRSFAGRRALWLPLLAVSAVVPYFNSVVGGRGNGLYLVWMMGVAITCLLNGAAKNNAAAQSTDAPSSASDLVSQGRPAPNFALLSSILFVCACTRTVMIKSAYDLTFAAFLMGAIYFMVRGLDLKPAMYGAAAKRWIKFAADYSFTLYLIHYSIFFLIAPLASSISPYVLFAAGFAGSNVIAALLACCTEMKHKQVAKKLIAKFC